LLFGWLVDCSRGLLIALMMEVARTSETLVNFYQTTRRCNPEDDHQRTKGSKVITAVTTSIVVFRIATSCGLVRGYQRLSGKYRLHFIPEDHKRQKQK
jgi:hypothetical protein